MRNDSKLTNIGLKQQLRCLPAGTVPFLGRGCLEPDTESELRGVDTTSKKSCNPKSSEFYKMSFEIFDSLCYNPQAEGTVVFPVNESGVDTRHTFMETYRNGENCKPGRNFSPTMRNCDVKEMHKYSAGRYDSRGNKTW
jgi:hypothetical protein